MKAIRANFVLRTAIAVLAFVAFVMLSNHCALSGMLAHHASQTPAEEGGCCQNPLPQKNKSPCPQIPNGCCKTLKVMIPDGAKVPAASVVMTAPIFAERLEANIPALTENDRPAPSTGPPPDSPSFAELVLHRSLRSHAPPVAA